MENLVLATKQIVYLQKAVKSLLSIEREMEDICMNFSFVHYQEQSRELEQDLSMRQDELSMQYQYKANSLKDSFLVFLELIKLDKTRDKFIEDMKRFNTIDDYLGEFHPRYDCFESHFCTYLDSIIGMISGDYLPNFDNDIKIQHASSLEKLELLLSQTAYWTDQFANLAKIEVCNEQSIQVAMNLVLASNFGTQYKPTVVLTSPIKNYKPDGGILNLRCCIEYKYIDDKSKIGPIFDALNSDILGYKRKVDEHYQFFYTFIYLTEHFEGTNKLIEEIEKNGKGYWKAFVGVGNGKTRNIK